MSLTDDLLDRYSDLWDEMLSHPFLDQMSQDELDDTTFNQWLRQDYEFVAAALPFVSAIKTKAPDDHLRPLGEAEMALHDELELFEERAAKLGVDVEDVSRNLTTQSYIQHLMATAFREDYPIALTVYWTAEKAYHESWKMVQPGLPEDHKWSPFVHNWAGDEFAEFVGFLEGAVNQVGADLSQHQYQRAMDYFQWTVRYEIAFWDMAYGSSADEWIKHRN